jgi:exportin-1
LGDQTYNERHRRDWIEPYGFLLSSLSHAVLTFVTVCLEIINNFAAAENQIANQFFQQYYLSILQDTFFVLTDADHKSGFKLQSLLLARMVQLVATDGVHAPLFDPAVVNDPNMTNAKFVRDYTANLLKSAFPHASR